MNKEEDAALKANLEAQMDALKKLREPFQQDAINYKPMPMCSMDEYKKLTRAKCAMCGGYHAKTHTDHLAYVGHAALTARLLQVDPLWSWEPLALDEKGLPRFDSIGGMWIKLTICGVTRLGYGHAKDMPYSEIGSREKAVIGDALRNAAMRFGAALEFWHKGKLPDEGEQPESGSPAATEIAMPVAKESNGPQAAPQKEQPSNPSSAQLAEQGELAFISKKLASLPDGGVALLKTLGMESLDDLTKENFTRIKNALKKK